VYNSFGSGYICFFIGSVYFRHLLLSAGHPYLPFGYRPNLLPAQHQALELGIGHRKELAPVVELNLLAAL
jgi:hypothetical protein